MKDLVVPPQDDLTTSEHFVEIKGTKPTLALLQRSKCHLLYYRQVHYYLVGIIQVQYRTPCKNYRKVFNIRKAVLSQTTASSTLPILLQKQKREHTGA